MRSSAVSPMSMEAQENKFSSKTRSNRKDQSADDAFIKLVHEAGFRWEIRGPRKLNKQREKNPELEKVKQILEKVYREELDKKPFWTLERRRQLREISVRIFTGSIIASVVLVVITVIWLHHFFTVYNVYFVPTNYSEEESLVELKSPFIRDIKDAEWAFSEYLVGILLLFIGSLSASYARRRHFNHRALWYLIAIIFLLATIVFFVFAPLIPLMTSNNSKEIQELQDEIKAHQNHVQGTIKFYKNGQCANITKDTTTGDGDTRLRMKFFCQMVSRLEGFLYFMWFTIIIPAMGFVFCWLELMANKRSWDMKVQYNYKKRTQEQIEADKSKSRADVTHQTEVELLY